MSLERGQMPDAQSFAYHAQDFGLEIIDDSELLKDTGRHKIKIAM